MSSPITTHILDTSRGKAAAGVAVTLHRASGDNRNDDCWQLIGSGRTNADGRCADLIAASDVDAGGAAFDASTSAVYKLHFAVGAYFAEHQVDAFYPHVEVVFRTSVGQRHYHIPLLLNAFGYSTYRGT